VEIMVPEDLMGDVMTDLQTRRSIIMGIDGKGRYQVIKSRTPLSELDKYSTTLRSITHGKASFTLIFAEYAVLPREIQNELAKKYKDLETA
ncbi:MAG: elongation factor G, partial [Bacteroidetes bacterium]